MALRLGRGPHRRLAHRRRPHAPGLEQPATDIAVTIAPERIAVGEALIRIGAAVTPIAPEDIAAHIVVGVRPQVNCRGAIEADCCPDVRGRHQGRRGLAYPAAGIAGRRAEYGAR